jgi:hypothetical protein
VETILDVMDLNDFDGVTKQVVENTRKALGVTSSEIADQLGWAHRKYQRLLEAAEEDGAINRDMALAIYGLARLKLSKKAVSTGFSQSVVLETVPIIFSHLAGNEDSWRVKVAPYLMRNLIELAKKGSTTTYGAEAERLEDAGRTDRVWPRTVYGHPLGLICDVCMSLSQVEGRRVPLLSSIVVAKSGLPGPGIDGMVQRFLRTHDDNHKDSWREFRSDRAAGIASLQQEVFNFRHWDEVAVKAGLS